MTSIAERVFAVAELLELILLQLPMKDVLLHQRTCKAVRNTVEGSDALKKKLFLLPAELTIDPIENARERSWTLSCLSCSSVNVQFNPAVLVERMDVYSHQSSKYHIPYHRLRKWPPAVVSLDEFENATCWKIEVRVTPAENQAWHRGVLNESASWRSMFLTQPPITALSFCNDYHESRSCMKAGARPWEIYEPFITFWNPKGLRLGDLHEEVRDLRNRYPDYQPFRRGEYSLDACFDCEDDGHSQEKSLTRLIAGCKGVLGRDGSCDCMRNLWREDLPEPSEEMDTLLSLCKKGPET